MLVVLPLCVELNIGAWGAVPAMELDVVVGIGEEDPGPVECYMRADPWLSFGIQDYSPEPRRITRVLADIPVLPLAAGDNLLAVLRRPRDTHVGILVVPDMNVVTGALFEDPL